MKIYVDIDNTICSQVVGDYGKAEPWHDNIAKINKLYDEGNEIIYYTARGTISKINWYFFYPISNHVYPKISSVLDNNHLNLVDSYLWFLPLHLS